MLRKEVRIQLSEENLKGPHVKRIFKEANKSLVRTQKAAPHSSIVIQEKLLKSKRPFRKPMTQTTNICFSCCKKKKLSEEHVIPQALGGKLSAWIYCVDCNSQFGTEIDSDLIKAIHFFGTALDIKRVRGKNQPYDVSLVENGTKLTFDGRELKRKKPIVKIERDGNKIKYVDVTAGSEVELRQICSNIKKKYDLSDEIEYFEEKHPGPTDTVTEFEFDNEKIRRCVAKIAYSLLCVKLPSDQAEYGVGPQQLIDMERIIANSAL